MKSKSILSSFLTCLVFVLATSLHGKAQAAGKLSISDDDIKDGHYVYTLTFDDMKDSQKFNNDTFFQDHVRVVQELNYGFNYVCPDPTDNSGYTKASFIYKFDFSNAHYRPTSLALTDTVTVFYNDPKNVLDTVTTEYSLDGTTYTPLLTASTLRDKSVHVAGGTPVNIDLSSKPSAVYYRVTFVANTQIFGWHWTGIQWNRLTAGASTTSPPFKADFTVEPSL